MPNFSFFSSSFKSSANLHNALFKIFYIQNIMTSHYHPATILGQNCLICNWFLYPNPLLSYCNNDPERSLTKNVRSYYTLLKLFSWISIFLTGTQSVPLTKNVRSCYTFLLKLSHGFPFFSLIMV